MQYFPNLSNSGPVHSPAEHNQPVSTTLAELRSHLPESATEPGCSQRVAISKAYGDILLNGGHLGC